MQLRSINLSSGSDIRIGTRVSRTGIAKTAVPEAVIEPLGLSGDVVANARHHGGPDQAIYVYSAEDYAWWETILERSLPPGTFGENLTLSGFGPGPVRIGDRYQVGSALLEVTAPRIPCSTLAAHMGDPDFIERFRNAERPGFYARVLTPAAVRVGDPVSLDARPAGASLVDLYRLWYVGAPAAGSLKQALAAPIAIRMRARFERLLAETSG